MNLKNVILELWSNRKIESFAFHFFLCTLTWIISKYIAVGPYIKDNAFIVNSFCFLFFLQTIFLYYFFSIVIFPRYLYTIRIIPLLIVIIISFLLIYWSNYISIHTLLPYSDGFLPNGQKDLWLLKIYDRLHNSGWFGCFTNPFTAYWNYGFSFEIAVFYLCIKAFRDIIFIQKKNLLLEMDNVALERDNLVLELSFLKSQINPHFLFNTLNSIYTRTVDVDEQASDLVLKLSDLMRYSLYGVNEDKVPLKEELEYIKNYLDLEKYRHSQNLVDISFAAEGDTESYKIAPLLLISFVENAFKHGVNLSRKSSYVHVSAVIEDHVLYFSVQNSLPEQVKSQLVDVPIKKSGGVGLNNTRKRLDLLYLNRHKLTFHQTEVSYEAMLNIELDLIA